MSQEERLGTQDRAYSAWHRRFSTARFVGIEKAQLLAMIDLDAALYVEYDDRSKDPLVLIETALDVGQNYKAATVTRNLARRARVPAYVLLYRHAACANPADPRYYDIDRFRVKRLWPLGGARWLEFTPSAWAKSLLDIRAWSARRINAERIEAANDPRYHNEPPAFAAWARGGDAVLD